MGEWERSMCCHRPEGTWRHGGIATGDGVGYHEKGVKRDAMRKSLGVTSIYGSRIGRSLNLDLIDCLLF
jgi:hypothetical protein